MSFLTKRGTSDTRFDLSKVKEVAHLKDLIFSEGYGEAVPNRLPHFSARRIWDQSICCLCYLSER